MAHFFYNYKLVLTHTLKRCDKDLVFISGFSRRGHRFDFFRSLFSRVD